MNTIDTVRTEDRRAFTVKEFCSAHRISRSYAYKLMSQGKLRSVRIGAKRLIPVEASAELLNGDPK
jgi:excisionase family DNA binding protein